MPNRTEKRLERADAGIDQRPNVLDVAWDHAAVKAAIDPDLALGRGLLQPQGFDRRRHRARIERHVDERRDAARGRGRVAVSNPSQSVRPGSLMWTCESTRPGMSQ